VRRSVQACVLVHCEAMARACLAEAEECYERAERAGVHTARGRAWLARAHRPLAAVRAWCDLAQEAGLGLAS
jgi:hypothetical protein